MWSRRSLASRVALQVGGGGQTSVLQRLWWFPGWSKPAPWHRRVISGRRGRTKRLLDFQKLPSQRSVEENGLRLPHHASVERRRPANGHQRYRRARAGLATRRSLPRRALVRVAACRLTMGSRVAEVPRAATHQVAAVFAGAELVVGIKASATVRLDPEDVREACHCHGERAKACRGSRSTLSLY
jgi:hypothetical protein